MVDSFFGEVFLGAGGPLVKGCCTGGAAWFGVVRA